MAEVKIFREFGKYFILEGGSKIGELDPRCVKTYEIKPMVMGWNIFFMTPEKREEKLGVQRYEDIPRVTEELKRRGYTITNIREGWVRPGILSRI